MMAFDTYQTDGYFDELVAAPGTARTGMETFAERLGLMPEEELKQHQQHAERILFHMGITFNVYGDDQGAERIFPFDFVPRIITAQEWAWIERGLQQRLIALNHFIDDVYNGQRILKENVIPRELVESSAGFREACLGLQPPGGTWCHISGVDLVRDKDGQMYVLEDNLRCPSGVSYVIENREVMKRAFPQIFDVGRVRPVESYPDHLLAALQRVSPPTNADPRVALLTPGTFNSAYFEHSFLAQQMGVSLVEGRDLCVVDGDVMMRTTQGLERVHVIYRRIDDDFLDPRTFRPDSLLGVPGLMDAYRQGRVALANAPGGGVADDKVVYAFVPEMIRFYLGEDPIIPNVPTYLCWERTELAHVLDHLGEMVVKPANESGGYGMLVGPQATAAERAEFAERIRGNPRNYIAQPTLNLSRVPTLCGAGFEGRHVDLRPFVLMGDPPYVLPGGLTRVALRKGSLVVNSSQGGGSKDTWVLDGA